MFPYPLMFVAIVFMWLLLNGFSLGHFLLGMVVAMMACWGMASLRPEKPQIRNIRLIPGLAATILWDVVRSNVAVAFLILKGARHKSTSGFVTVPLELTNPVGLAILAVVLTSTPGSAWLEYDSREGTLLMHVLDLKNEDEWRALVKGRYEAKLIQILQS